MSNFKEELESMYVSRVNELDAILNKYEPGDFFDNDDESEIDYLQGSIDTLSTVISLYESIRPVQLEFDLEMS